MAAQAADIAKSGGRAGKMYFRHSFPGERATLSDGPDLHLRAVRQTRTFLGQGNGFIEAVDLQEEVTPHCLFRFGKRTIGNDPAVLAGNHFAILFQRAAGSHLALSGQPLKPSHPLAGHFLHFFWRKAFLPFVATEQEHVLRCFGLWAHICFCCIHY